MAAPHVGDRGEYKKAIVRLEGDNFTVVEETQLRLLFEWQEPRTQLDREGRRIWVNVLQARWHKGSGWSGGEWSVDVDGNSVSNGHNRNMVWRHYTSNGSWQPFCGFMNPLQGQEVPSDQPIVICDNGRESRVELRAVGVERLGERTAVRFEGTYQGRLTNGTTLSGRVFYSYTADVPYPLRLAVELPNELGKFQLLQLNGFDRGAAPLSRELHAEMEAPPLQTAPRPVWMIDDASLDGRHPFRLSEAFAAARDDFQRAEVREFLAAHPDAYVDYARMDDESDQVGYRYNWTFGLAAASDGLEVSVAKVVGPPVYAELLGVPLPPAEALTLPEETSYKIRIDPAPRAAYPPPEWLPSHTPTAESLLARATSFLHDVGFSHEANAWAFDFRCNSPCPRERWSMHWYEAGRQHFAQTRGVLEPDTYTYHLAEVNFGSDDSVWRIHVSELGSEWSTTPSSAQPAAFSAEVVGPVWRLPPKEWVVGSGVVAVTAGLAYWMWPLLKAMPVGLFTRITRSKALDQQVRQELFELVQAEPGLHVEEIVRRTGRHRTPVDHHLKKLVATGLLQAHAAGGYVCYFPQGTDRRVQQAAPLLKSDGAHEILAALMRQPGLNTSQLARAVGLRRQSVQFHVARLQEAGLVQREADAALRLTDTGARIASGEPSASP